LEYIFVADSNTVCDENVLGQRSAIILWVGTEPLLRNWPRSYQIR